MAGPSYSLEDDVRELLSDEYLLTAGWSAGFDPRDLDQLLDAAAVGFTVKVWRNSPLEDVHAGFESESAARSAKPDHRAQRELIDQPVRDYTEVADPAEVERIAEVVGLAAVGGGIPDDVMLRMNVSTVRDVRSTLASSLGVHGIEPSQGDDPSADVDSLYLHDLVQLLADPERVLYVGDAEFAVVKLFGERWGEYLEHVHRSGRNVRWLAEVIGARRALWSLAVGGAANADGWYPNRTWIEAVRRLRTLSEGDEAAALRFSDGPHVGVPNADADSFWDAVAIAPHVLNGRQALWLIHSRLRSVMDQVRREYARGLGASEEMPPNVGLMVL